MATAQFDAFLERVQGVVKIHHPGHDYNALPSIGPPCDRKFRAHHSILVDCVKDCTEVLSEVPIGENYSYIRQIILKQKNYSCLLKTQKCFLIHKLENYLVFKEKYSII